MQNSSALAADTDLSVYFTAGDDTVKLLTVVPVVNPDGLIIKMKPGNDLGRLGANGFVFDGTFGTTATVSGGSGTDLFDVTANASLTVGGLTTIKSVETVRVTGTFDANGGLDLLGTAAGDVMLYSGTGTLNVSGGNFELLTKGGDDTFTTKAGSAIEVDGADAIFDGGSGVNTFNNNGHVATLNGGNIVIDNFQTVTNSGNSFDAAGNFTYDGSGGVDTFTNDGALNAGGNGTFEFKGGGDTLQNNATGIINLTGAGSVIMGAGADDLNNLGRMTAASWTIDGGGGADSLTNSGSLIGGSVAFSNIETVINSGAIRALTAGVTYTGTAGVDTFTNTAAGVVNSATAASFSFAGGNDILSNSGLIVVGSGNASFDAGGGTANQLLNDGTIRTNGGDIVIDRFQTVTNGGNLKASANITHTGSGVADTFTNNGSVLAGGNGSFAFKAGADEFSNNGTMTLTGTGTVDLGTGADLLINTGTMKASAWTLDGGADAIDQLNNTGKIVGGTIAISGFESVINGIDSNILASVGGVTYTGTGTADTFTNRDGAVVNSATALVFGFGGGDDLLDNQSGGLIVVQSGDAIFNGGTGTNTFLNNGEVKTNAGDIVISNFSNVTNNNNTFDAAGNFSYDGTAGADTFTNNGSLLATGNGTFKGEGGVDAFANTGLMDFGANDTRISGFESAVNTGTMAFNTAGNAPATAFTVIGDFTNGAGGALDIQQGSYNAGTGLANASGVYGDAIDINGIFTSAAAASVMLDTMLTGAAPVTDTLTATTLAGTVNLDIAFVTSGSKGLLPGKLVVIENSGAALDAGVSINGKPVTAIAAGANAGVNISQLIGGSFGGGFVEYYIRNAGGDIYYESVLDADKAGGIAAGLASTVSSISAIFHKPISALVSRCKADDADGKGYGTWARASGGQLDTNSKGSYSYTGGSGNLATQNEVDYVGLQSGLDMASCDTGSGSTYHVGITSGYMTGRSNQVGTPDRLSVDFDTNYLGVYATLIHESGFTADYTLRYDWHSFDLSHTDASAVRPGTEVDGSTISSSVGASYTFVLGESTSIRPGVGVLVGKTSVNSFNSASGEFSFEDQVSIMATAGLTAQHVFEVADTTRLVAFVSGNVFNEFGDNPQATINLGGTDVDTEMDNVGTFGQLSAGLTLLESADPGSPGPDMTGTLRFDAQFGERLEGWGVTGQVRLQF